MDAHQLERVEPLLEVQPPQPQLGQPRLGRRETDPAPLDRARRAGPPPRPRPGRARRGPPAPRPPRAGPAPPSAPRSSRSSPDVLEAVLVMGPAVARRSPCGAVPAAVGGRPAPAVASLLVPRRRPLRDGLGRCCRADGLAASPGAEPAKLAAFASGRGSGVLTNRSQVGLPCLSGSPAN